MRSSFLPCRRQCSVILNANDYLFFDLAFRMLDAEMLSS